MSKSDVLSIRIDDKIRQALQKESDHHKKSVNSQINQILSDYYTRYSFAKDLRWVNVFRSFFRDVLNSVDLQTIIKLSKTSGKEDLRTLIEFIYGDITAENILEQVEKWLDSMNTSYRHITDGGKNKYVITNDLGKNFAVYAVTTTESLLNEIGYKFENVTYTDNCFSFEIVKTQ